MVMAAMDLEERMRHIEDRTTRNELKLQGHEDTCALRYRHLDESLNAVARNQRAAAIAGASIGLAVLGFLIKLVFFP